LRNNCAVNNEDSKTLVENFNVSKIFEQLASEEDDVELIDEGWYIYTVYCQR
jgi:hypothetical protein